MEPMIVAIPFCCLGVFVLAGFGLVIMLISRQSQPYSAQETAQAETSASDFFSRTVPTLLPWQPGAPSTSPRTGPSTSPRTGPSASLRTGPSTSLRTGLADLSCQWQGTRSGLLIGQYRGLVKSLSQPDGAGLLAYYLSLKGRRGFVRLRTSEREVRLEIEANEGRVSVGGQLLGRINLHEGAIGDSEDRPIGHYHRHRGMRWQVGSRPLSARYGPVELHGRTVAEVNDALVRSGGLFDAGAASRPLVRNTAPGLTPEEENWLLAVVAVELYHDARRHRTRRRNF